MTPKAQRDLDSLSPDVARRILLKVFVMRDDLRGDVKRLKAMTPGYRLRVGDYRVLFEVEGDRVVVYRVCHRREAYRNRRAGIMIQFHPEFLKKNGKNEFVVLPYHEFVTIQELLEDAEDLLLLEQAKREDHGKPGVSLEEVMKRFGITAEDAASSESAD